VRGPLSELLVQNQGTAGPRRLMALKDPRKEAQWVVTNADRPQGDATTRVTGGTDGAGEPYANLSLRYKVGHTSLARGSCA
jgi:hypothetical protein